ncbi:hypothetical protein EBB07_11575 [Paenibacillaceae bacterium]|nr:hypothetical protein EBB07_11575 [Paenibacillaceae bacterium]
MGYSTPSFIKLAVLQIQFGKDNNKKQPNLIFYDYYQCKVAEGRLKKQILIYVKLRLDKIIYGMRKNKTHYIAAAALTQRKSN